MPSFFWFGPFLEARAEIKKKIGSNENKKICFQNLLTFKNLVETETNELNVSPSKVKIKEEILLDEVKDEIKMEITDDNFSTWVENKQHQKKNPEYYTPNLSFKFGTHVIKSIFSLIIKSGCESVIRTCLGFFWHCEINL